MSPRNLCLGLTSLVALLFAVSAQAGEVSMDVRGYAAETEQVPASNHVVANEARDADVDSSSVEIKPRNRPKWRNATAASGQPLLTDDIDAETGKPIESVSGSSSSSISVPVKPRNRWQSLVPGAIK